MTEGKKIHILFLSSWFPTSKGPFDGNFVIRHAEAAALYSKVSFINVTTDPLLDKSPLEIGPDISLYEYVIKMPRSIPVLTALITYLLKFYHYGRLYNKICRLEGRPNLIHANVLFPGALYALFLKLISGLPFIVSEHWTGFLPEKRVHINPVKWMIIKYVAKKASLICPVSQYLEGAMLEKGIKGKYRVVPNVVNTNLFSIRAEHKSREIFQFLHISSLIDEHKNTSGLINAVQLLAARRHDFQFQIITCARDRYWEERVEKLELSDFIKFNYAYGPTQIAEFFIKCDAFVMFSNYETFGVVVIEAFASGVPVISTRVQPIDAFVTSDRGILTEVGNEPALASAMADLIDRNRSFDKEKIRAYAVQNYSYESIGQQFQGIYREISRK